MNKENNNNESKTYNKKFNIIKMYKILSKHSMRQNNGNMNSEKSNRKAINLKSFKGSKSHLHLIKTKCKKSRNSSLYLECPSKFTIRKNNQPVGTKRQSKSIPSQ